MSPDISNHNPDPEYIRLLLSRIGISQAKAAKQLGIDPRTMRRYVLGELDCPYPVQFCLEAMLRAAETRSSVLRHLKGRVPVD